jgi:hypothetical protein
MMLYDNTEARKKKNEELKRKVKLMTQPKALPAPHETES